MTTTISKNIDFLRWKTGTHKELAEKLEGVINGTRLSQYAQDDRTPEAKTTQAIENKLNLPSGWCDRDNLAFTQLSATDYELVSSVLVCKPAMKRALRELVLAVREEI